MISTVLSFLILLILLSILFLPPISRSKAINGPTDVSGLQLWLDSSEPNSLYKDAAKTQLATAESDKIAVWADKSGNGFDATQTTVGNQPLLTLNKDGGQVGVKFGASTNTLLNFGNPGALNFGNNGNFTVFCVFKSTGGGVYQGILHKGSVGADDRTFWLLDTGKNKVRRYITTQSPSTYNSSSANLYAYSFAPTSATAGVEVNYLNGNATRTATSGLPDFLTANTWNIGGDGTFALTGYIQALYIYNRTLTGVEANSVNQYMAGKFGFTWSSTTNQIVYDGNSITAGTGVETVFSENIYSNQTAKFPFLNLGISGYTTGMLISGAAAKVDPYYSATFAKNILVGWEGTNDIKTEAAADGTAAYNNLVTYYNARKAVGWKNISITILPRNDTAAFETKRQAANTLLRANYANFSEAMVDMGNDPNMGQDGQAVTAYYLDNVHPSSAGHTIITGRVQKAVDALANPISAPSSITTSSTSTTATVTWATNVVSSSIVNYGETSAYGSDTTEVDNTSGTRTLNHSVSISNLDACTEYHYKVASNQLSAANDLIFLKNNLVESGDSTFYTTGCPPAAPVPVPIPSAPTPSVSLLVPSPASVIQTIHYYTNAPLASFIAPSARASDSAFTFDASESFSTKGIVAYFWDFGDGTTSDAMKIDHQYQSPGRYTVTLTVTDKAGKTSTKTQIVDVNPPKPTVEDISADGNGLVFKGKSYPKTIVHLTIHSNPITDQTTVDDNGLWTYKVANAKEVLGAGDHTVLASAAYVLADQTELKSEPSKTYDFKVSLDDGNLKVEMGKTRTWQYVSLGLGLVLLIIIGFVLLRRRR